MKRLTLLLLLVPAAVCAKTRRDCPDLDPGRAYAGFVLGEKTDRAVQPDAMPGWYLAKEAAVRLRLDADGKVAEIEAPLPACVVARRRTLESRDARHLAALLGACGPVQVAEGGSTIECDGLLLGWGGFGGRQPPTLRVVKRPAPSVACAAYLDRGEYADAKGVQPAAGREIVVAIQGPVCTMRAALTPATTPGEVRREPCAEDARRGGVHVVCPEAVYSFAGPKQTLSRITAR